MKPDNWNRFAAGLLAILLCLCSFSMPAFASGSDPAPEPLPEILDEKTTTGGMEPEGVPITPKGNATLVDDFYGDKQLITVTTKAGNYFYILIDRANEDKETSVHFLNQVDDADLLALLDEEPQTAEVCTCTVKCEAGNVNENCPLCEKSLRNCTAPEAVKTDTETPQEKPKSNMGSLMILLVLALAGGGAALYYFKFRKPKADTTGHDDLDEYDFGEDELEPSRDPQLAAFYQVIVDKGNQQMTAGDSLDNLAATADPVYERQVDELMEKIMADVDENTRARQEGRRPENVTLSDYVDYRTYLDYDIKVTNTVSGQQAYLSRVSRDSSGGENQAPFYVAICASLLQIYQKSENSIRLVLLDEAFSKMTSDRIRPMMELFRRLQLQVLLISTVEKSTAIQPYCDITYSIVRHGDANAIAPFYRLRDPAEEMTAKEREPDE